MSKKHISEWVNSNPKHKAFRQAIHIILMAISNENLFAKHLVLKGGIVMDIVYDSGRYTSDLDITSILSETELSKETLREKLDLQLKKASIISNYGMQLRVQSIKRNPSNKGKVQFPSYKLKVGYAYSDNDSAMRSLRKGESRSTAQIDISFNEPINDSDACQYQIDAHSTVLLYSTERMIAEKYRSLLQQDKRNRNRRQDVFDIYHLITSSELQIDKSKVLATLYECSKNKGIDDYLQKSALRKESIKERSMMDIHTLEQETEVTVDGETMYTKVAEYFESLPWETAE